MTFGMGPNDHRDDVLNRTAAPEPNAVVMDLPTAFIDEQGAETAALKLKNLEAAIQQLGAVHHGIVESITFDRHEIGDQTAKNSRNRSLEGFVNEMNGFKPPRREYGREA